MTRTAAAQVIATPTKGPCKPSCASGGACVRQVGYMMKQIYFRTSSSQVAGPARNPPAMLVSLASTGLIGLLLIGSGCSSDSTSSGSGGQGGSPTSTAGTSADGGKSSSGASTGGSTADGGATAHAGSSLGGSASAGETSSGGEIWGCIEAGGVCICQNDTDKAHESVCTGTYKCCATIPFAGATRCQCQDPGTTKCVDDPANNVKVVAKCPP